MNKSIRIHNSLLISLLLLSLPAPHHLWKLIVWLLEALNKHSLWNSKRTLRTSSCTTSSKTLYRCVLMLVSVSLARLNWSECLNNFSTKLNYWINWDDTTFPRWLCKTLSQLTHISMLLFRSKVTHTIRKRRQECVHTRIIDEKSIDEKKRRHTEIP